MNLKVLFEVIDAGYV